MNLKAMENSIGSRPPHCVVISDTISFKEFAKTLSEISDEVGFLSECFSIQMSKLYILENMSSIHQCRKIFLDLKLLEVTTLISWICILRTRV
jgi:hypothetical protein